MPCVTAGDNGTIEIHKSLGAKHMSLDFASHHHDGNNFSHKAKQLKGKQIWYNGTNISPVYTFRVFLPTYVQ